MRLSPLWLGGLQRGDDTLRSGLGIADVSRSRATSFAGWTSTYQWENIYGYDFLYAGPLFIHQFSHAWIDFRGIQD